MTIINCINGHKFNRTGLCKVCPVCSREKLNKIYKNDFPKIGQPALRALNTLGIKNLQDLTKYTKDELLELHGFGPKALKILKLSLHQNNLKFRN